MKKVFPFLILLIISVTFFYKSFFFFQVPFPGDLLISEYAPWKYESYLGYNPGSYPNKGQYFDVIRQLYPWKLLSVDQIKNGELPLWNPYNFSGSPLLANNQSAALYPLNILFYFLSPGIAWTFYIILQPLLASLFMYLYVKGIKLSSKAAVIASVAFGFSLFMSTFLEYGNIGHTFLWLPLILFCIEQLKQGKKNFAILLSLAGASVFFAGHFQIALSLTLFSVIYGVVVCFGRVRTIVVALLPLVIGIGISSIQTIPTLELLQNSARVAHESKIINELFLLQPLQIILLLVPDMYGNPATRTFLLTDTYPGNAIYIGVIPLLLAIYSVVNRKKDRVWTFFLCAVIGFGVLFIRNPISEFIFNQKMFSASSPSNFFFLLGFCLSVLSAYGYDSIKRFGKKTALVMGITLLSLIFLVLLHKAFVIPFSQKQLILGLAFFGIGSVVLILHQLVKRNVIFLAVVVVLVIDLMYYFVKFNPFVPGSLLFPKTSIVAEVEKVSGFNRYIGYKAGVIESNFSTMFRTFSPDGYDPLYLKTYNSYTDSPSRSDAVVDLKAKKQVNELGVKYVLDRKENGSDETIFDPAIFDKKLELDGWSIFENKNSLPRTYILSGNKVVPAEIKKYSSTFIEISKPSIAGTLVLTDNYYPGWEVKVDGRKSSILKINDTFRGVEVKKEDSLIKFEYKPKSFYIGAILTIISLGGLVLIVFFRKILWKLL